MKLVKVKIRIPNHPASDHLRLVKRQMVKRGRPVIRAIPTLDGWLALEGSHRITAAQDLGLPIVIKPMGSKQRMRTDVFLDDHFDNARRTVSKIRDEILGWAPPIYLYILAHILEKP